MLNRIKGLFSKEEKPVVSKPIDAAEFLSYLIDNPDAVSFREELLPRINAFKSKNSERQAEELPGLYLFVEKYIFKSSTPDLRDFRKEIGTRFWPLIKTHPDFQIIFLSNEEQRLKLSNRFLAFVCKGLSQFLGSSSDSPWGALEKWLNHLNDPQGVPFTGDLKFTTHKPRAGEAVFFEDYEKISRDFFREMEMRFNTSFVLNHFNLAYDSLAVNFRNLDSFQELIKLFPNKALDESKLNLLSIQQIRELLLEKVNNLERLSAELQLRNDQLNHSMTELNKQSYMLNEQNRMLQDAQQMIEEKNRELQAQTESLETIVEKRTREVETANKILTQYNENLEGHAFAISHHVKAPVARIMGLIYLLNNHRDEIDTNEVLVKLEDSVGDLNLILADLVRSLNIKKEASHVIMESVDLGQLVKDIFEELKRQYNIHVKLSVSVTGSKNVHSDRRYLTQALKYILDNSFKFRGAESDLTIDTSISSNKTHLQILISDNGMGFPLKDVQERLFTPFQRFNTSRPGKGMGLYFSKQLIDVLNGWIEIDSQPGMGTKVVLSLPNDQAASV